MPDLTSHEEILLNIQSKLIPKKLLFTQVGTAVTSHLGQKPIDQGLIPSLGMR